MFRPEHCAVIIPCHNEAATIAQLVTAARRHVSTVIVVDDGSTDDTAARAEKSGALVLTHPQRRGKGAALHTGLRHAVAQHFIWAATLDGDGQHQPDDLPRFFAAAQNTGAQLIIGNRMGAADDMPPLRRSVNRLMSSTLSKLARQPLPDSQCGFRLLDLRVWSPLAVQAKHFEFESELLLAFCRAGSAVAFVPIAVIYAGERSKISPLRDTCRWLLWLHRARRTA
ncbi:MAG: Undecaprenyl-phosphate 4-deoxy-4-formamido-L-arabinose transferase [Verrucomicrobiota bacterium]|jgi:glycosyltransferase involved in cell wall biosynthesis